MSGDDRNMRLALVVVASISGCGSPAAVVQSTEAPIAPNATPITPATPAPATETAGSTAAPQPAAPTTIRPDEPPLTTLPIGAHALVIRHDTEVHRQGFISTMDLDGASFWPPECERSRVGLCSWAHRQLRSVDGRGRDLMLIGSHRGAHELRIVFAATFHGSPECGNYGVWTMRIDADGTPHVADPRRACLGGNDLVRIQWEPFRVAARPYSWMPNQPKDPWLAVPTPPARRTP